jgi:hypothetical protein
MGLELPIEIPASAPPLSILTHFPETENAGFARKIRQAGARVNFPTPLSRIAGPMFPLRRVFPSHRHLAAIDHPGFPGRFRLTAIQADR